MGMANMEDGGELWKYMPGPGPVFLNFLSQLNNKVLHGHCMYLYLDVNSENSNHT